MKATWMKMNKMRWMMPAALAAAMATACNRSGSNLAPAPEPPSLRPAGAMLPVQRVTLYAGGSAYIEHAGDVAGDEPVALYFKSNQVDGVLKSITARDGDGRPIAVIAQAIGASSDSSSSTRRFDLSGNPSLVSLVEQIRGASVRLICADETINGVILSLEKRDESSSSTSSNSSASTGSSGFASSGSTSPGATSSAPADARAGSAQRLNVLSNGSLRSIPFDAVRRFELVDPRIGAELKKSMEAMWTSTEEGRRGVVVRAAGARDGQGPLRLGYLVENAAWKPTYRLELGSSPALELWASVTNETEMDWRAVGVDLMAGRPIVLAGETAVDSSAVDRATRAGGAPAGEPLRQPRPTPSRAALDEPAAVDPTLPQTRPALGPAISAAAFSSHIDKLTIPAKQKASAPVGRTAVQVERISLYSEKLAKRNPLRGARIRNAGGQYLLSGPVTVFEGATYAGDGAMENLAPGRSAVVTWGVELAMGVEASEILHTMKAGAARIEKGVIQVDREHTYARRYLVENESDAACAVLIDHPRRRGYALAEPAAPEESTETSYRFTVQAPPAQRTSLLVRERASEIEAVDLATAEADTLRTLADEKALPDPIRAAAAKAASLRQRIDDARRQASALAEQLDQADRSDPVSAPTRPASGEPSTAQSLRKELEQARAAATAAEKSLRDYAAGLNVP